MLGPAPARSAAPRRGRGRDIVSSSSLCQRLSAREQADPVPGRAWAQGAASCMERRTDGCPAPLPCQCPAPAGAATRNRVCRLPSEGKPEGADPGPRAGLRTWCEIGGVRLSAPLSPSVPAKLLHLDLRALRPDAGCTGARQKPRGCGGQYLPGRCVGAVSVSLRRCDWSLLFLLRRQKSGASLAWLGGTEHHQPAD